MLLISHMHLGVSYTALFSGAQLKGDMICGVSVQLQLTHRNGDGSNEVRRNIPSRSTSCSCARLSKSSPSFPSIVLISFPFASLKVTLILSISVFQLCNWREAYPVPGAGLTRSPCLITVHQLMPAYPGAASLHGVDENARLGNIDPDLEEEGTDRVARGATKLRAD